MTATMPSLPGPPLGLGRDAGVAPRIAPWQTWASSVVIHKAGPADRAEDQQVSRRTGPVRANGAGEVKVAGHSRSTVSGNRR